MKRDSLSVKFISRNMLGLSCVIGTSPCYVFSTDLSLDKHLNVKCVLGRSKFTPATLSQKQAIKMGMCIIKGRPFYINEVWGVRDILSPNATEED